MFTTTFKLVGGLVVTLNQVSAADLRDQVDRFVSVVNANDPKALAAMYSTAPTVTSLGNGYITVGPSPVAALLESFIGTGVKMTVDSVVAMPLGRDAGMATFRYRFTRSGAQPSFEWGAMTVVFVRVPAGWRVAHDHTSSLPQAPQALQQPENTRAPLLSPVRALSPCQVTRIVDGDTIHCDGFGSVRLIGMDTPEGDQQPYGDLATQALVDLISVGSTVGLEFDVEGRDQYGRVLAYVWRDDVMVNWWMVRAGWAVVLTYPPNVQYVDWFTSAQREARDEGVGLWAIDGFACEPRARRRRQC